MTNKGSVSEENKYEMSRKNKKVTRSSLIALNKDKNNSNIKTRRREI